MLKLLKLLFFLLIWSVFSTLRSCVSYCLCKALGTKYSYHQWACMMQFSSIRQNIYFQYIQITNFQICYTSVETCNIFSNEALKSWFIDPLTEPTYIVVYHSINSPTLQAVNWLKRNNTYWQYRKQYISIHLLQISRFFHSRTPGNHSVRQKLRRLRRMDPRLVRRNICAFVMLYLEILLFATLSRHLKFANCKIKWPMCKFGRRD
jgi:hypothetical protein